MTSHFDAAMLDSTAAAERGDNSGEISDKGLNGLWFL
jgi:hypothetical protein